MNQTEECPYCGQGSHPECHVAKEMMFGSRDKFQYSECNDCGSLWLAEPISDEKLSSYYSGDYYSYSMALGGGLKERLLATRDRAELGRGSPIGRMLAKWRGDTLLQIIGSTTPGREARVVDVGSGGGRLLSRLHQTGMRSLTGVDPYVEKDVELPNGVRLLKSTLGDVEGEFDLIMFNHSLEHVRDPVRELQAAAAKLAPSGTVLVAVPTTSSDAWAEFGVDWFQLDAPRHLAIPSREGLRQAAGRAGFGVERIIDNSVGQQFYLSEGYRRGIPLKSFDLGSLSKDDAARYEKRAAAANQANRGDQFVAILKRTPAA